MSQRPVALVTGGRQGIGRAIVLALAGAGFDVAFTARRTDDNGRELIEACGASGVRACYLPSDLGDLDAQTRLIDAVCDWGGGLDCLVNNAGVPTDRRGDLLDLTPASFDRVLGINLRGTFFLSQAVARHMVAHPGPHYRSILFITSVSARMASPERGDYCLSKAAGPMMTALFSLRLADQGIGVFELRPGIVKTAMTEGVADTYTQRIEGGLVPMARWGTPKDIAQAVVPFAVGRMAFATGSAIDLDGGLSINRL